MKESHHTGDRGSDPYLRVFILKAVGKQVTTNLTVNSDIMGRLVIAHHKSYHPYRRDNIEKVKRDEEEARQKEAREEGRMFLAVHTSLVH
jgi:hypothetical protein